MYDSVQCYFNGKGERVWEYITARQILRVNHTLKTITTLARSTHD